LGKRLLEQQEEQMAGNSEVVVIGAGPAGLAVGACLRKQGLDFIILEKNHQVGSSWHRHYERLHLHTVKQLSALPYVPFPAGYPRYVPRNLMIEYLESYAATFNLKPRFGETVRSVRRSGSEWFIEATSSSTIGRHVVIASGLNTEPIVPSVPGIEKFTGKVIHSAAYVNAKPFVGQSVLVIGMGNTGAEIALDLCNGGARTTISIRHGVHVAPRDLFGIPIQIVAIFATQVLPMKANDALFPLILDMSLSYPAKYGIKRPNKGILRQIAESGRIPVLDVGTMRKIAEGAIEIVPGIFSATEDGVVFKDGSKGKFDTIVFATGFRPNYPSFLETETIELPNHSRPDGDRATSTIHFVGFKSPVSGLLREISKDAVRIAANVVRRHQELVRR
jgi:cation diffusion facilitator CzcD-associated flavoprotein CzcO